MRVELAGPSQLRLCLFGHGDEVRRVPACGRLALAEGVPSLGGVIPDDVEHAVPRIAGLPVGEYDEAVIDERAQLGDDIDSRLPGGAHGFGRAQRPAGKDRQAS